MRAVLKHTVERLDRLLGTGGHQFDPLPVEAVAQAGIDGHQAVSPGSRHQDIGQHGDQFLNVRPNEAVPLGAPPLVPHPSVRENQQVGNKGAAVHGHGSELIGIDHDPTPFTQSPIVQDFPPGVKRHVVFSCNRLPWSFPCPLHRYFGRTSSAGRWPPHRFPERPGFPSPPRRSATPLFPR